jgi:aminomethyltransferase
VLRSHQELRTRHGAGYISSGTYSPSLDVSIAFARLPVETVIGDDIEVNVRDKWLRARVVKYPFVRHGQSLIPGFPAINPQRSET